jgi:hypothetical protein
MAPKKKKEKKIKLKVGRGARGARQARQKKPSVKQIVNIYTTKNEPLRTDFREQLGYAQLLNQPVQTPFQPVFNYIPQPVESVAEPKIESAPKKTVVVQEVDIEEKPKRKYTRKPVAIGVALAEPSFSRQTSIGSGYASGFDTPNEREMFRLPSRVEENEVLAQKKLKAMEDELSRQQSAGEFMSGEASPIIPQVKRRGRPVGSKSKPKEAIGAQPVGQPNIMSFFGKVE